MSEIELLTYFKNSNYYFVGQNDCLHYEMRDSVQKNKKFHQIVPPFLSSWFNLWLEKKSILKLQVKKNFICSRFISAAATAITFPRSFLPVFCFYEIFFFFHDGLPSSKIGFFPSF